MNLLPYNPPKKCPVCGHFLKAPLHARGNHCECNAKDRAKTFEKLNEKAQSERPPGAIGN